MMSISLLMLLLLLLKIALSCKVAVFVLCYDDPSCAGVDVWVKNSSCLLRHRIPLHRQSVFMENYFYDFYVEHGDAFADFDYIGVLSHRARDKVVVSETTCTEPCTKGAVAYRWRFAARFGMLRSKSVAEFARIVHGATFVNCWARLLDAVGINGSLASISNLPRVYFNYWLAAPPVMHAYARLISQAKRIAVENNVIDRCLQSNPGYPRSLPRPFQTIGHWTSHPFVFERLLPAFLWNASIDPLILS